MLALPEKGTRGWSISPPIWLSWKLLPCGNKGSGKSLAPQLTLLQTATLSSPSSQGQRQERGTWGLCMWREQEAKAHAGQPSNPELNMLGLLYSLWSPNPAWNVPEPRQEHHLQGSYLRYFLLKATTWKKKSIWECPPPPPNYLETSPANPCCFLILICKTLGGSSHPKVYREILRYNSQDKTCPIPFHFWQCLIPHSKGNGG